MSIAGNFKKLFFYRQHPEAALRYLPIIDLLRKKHLERAKILEVGSGSLGLAPYLKKKIIGVDMNFGEPEYPFLKQVKASALKLPFSKKNFDVVILSDVLEHLPKKVRANALSEAVRVAKQAVIISGPFGEEAAKQDRELTEVCLKKTGKAHHFLEEHVRLGLPEESEIMAELKKDRRVKDVQVTGHYFNLRARRWLMNFFITNNKIVHYFYLKGLMFAVPLLRQLNNKPCYRTLIFVRCD